MIQHGFLSPFSSKNQNNDLVVCVDNFEDEEIMSKLFQNFKFQWLEISF